MFRFAQHDKRSIRRAVPDGFRGSAAPQRCLFSEATPFLDHGAGVCAFAGGVALGSCLPDSIIVGRIAPIASGFGVRGLGRRGTLVCPVRGSFLTGFGVAETVGNSAALGSESDPPVLAGCGELVFSNRSAASAPAIRICSAVSVVEPDFLSRDLGWFSAGAGDSDGVCSEDGAACLGASGFFSRPTITSCAWTCPTRTRLQSSALKNAFSMKSRDKQLRPIAKPS
jgi:hypothetical protein